MQNLQTSNALKAFDNKHFLHPWQDCNSNPSHYNMIVRSEGIYLYDSEGNKYIDGPGGMWCVNLGYGRKDIASAIATQCEKLPYSSPWFSTTEPAAPGAARSTLYVNFIFILFYVCQNLLTCMCQFGCNICSLC